MEFLSEDPTYLVGGLGITALVFLVLLKVTQQGKFLIRAAVAAGLALLVVGVERVWVTDNERIEQTVYSLAKAVEASNAQEALGLMTDDVRFVNRGDTMSTLLTRIFVQRTLQNAKFDFLRITRLKTNAGNQSRRGSAEFQVVASGSIQKYNELNFGSANSSWSLGFKETSPGIWKVNRITPVSVPGAQGVLPVADANGEIAIPPGIGEKGLPPRTARGPDSRGMISPQESSFRTNGGRGRLVPNIAP